MPDTMVMSITGLLLVTGIGIALGVVVGVFLLTVAVACYRRSGAIHFLRFPHIGYYRPQATEVSATEH